MITRIVRMEFESNNIEAFRNLFNNSCAAIRAMPGCLYLSLHQEEDKPWIFFTISKWNDPADLEFYRNSELFRTTWAATKALFAAKPAAWTLNPQAELL